jgi:solute:Na+ symporter, SSS family
MIFVIGSIIIFGLSNVLNKRDGFIKEHDLSVSFSGIREALLRFSAIQIPLITLCLTSIISPQFAAFPSALLTMGLFLWYFRQEKEEMPFYQSDIFYAGLLTSAMVWVMFFFA